MTNRNDIKPFLKKEYRDSYLEGYVKGRIAYQIKALRKKSGLSQKAFGDKIGKPQSVISRLENTEYGAVSVETLLDIAKALDIGLEIKFSDYVNVIEDDASEKSLYVDNVFESFNSTTDNLPEKISTATYDQPNILLVVTAGTYSWQTTTHNPDQLTHIRGPESGNLNTGKFIPMSARRA